MTQPNDNSEFVLAPILRQNVDAKGWRFGGRLDDHYHILGQSGLIHYSLWLESEKENP